MPSAPPSAPATDAAVRLALCFSLLATPLAAQLTTPERTGGRETSRHADVLAFLDTLQQRGADLRVGTLGTSTEGRRIPFVVAARPMPECRGELLHRSGCQQAEEPPTEQSREEVGAVSLLEVGR